MPTIDVAGCLTTYWVIWLVNGFGSILGLVINMVVSFALLKHFSNLAKVKPSVRKKHQTDFSMYRNDSPVPNTSSNPWDNDFNMDHIYGTSDA
ncbi:unnamed protein product [Rotaria sp. Silwood1]|nr:unnamed protein product [Rotaria sp. Silwood1]CAF1566170.1 unnamed protein product [Rotaria sp. Silwood1]CAF1600795.1 unnamed protein product [Rotaria sp. Silwood1]CAF4966158.1 unnamed protein product [Rotaria sp. Silwood1]